MLRSPHHVSVQWYPHQGVRPRVVVERACLPLSLCPRGSVDLSGTRQTSSAAPPRAQDLVQTLQMLRKLPVWQ